MPNPNPEGRLGVAFLLIGVVSATMFLLSVWAGNAANPVVLLSIVGVLLIGWGLRRAFRSSRPPPPPGVPFAARWRARLGSIGKKPAAPTKPAAPPPPKKGGMGFLNSKTKAPPKK